MPSHGGQWSAPRQWACARPRSPAARNPFVVCRATPRLLRFVRCSAPWQTAGINPGKCRSRNRSPARITSIRMDRVRPSAATGWRRQRHDANGAKSTASRAACALPPLPRLPAEARRAGRRGWDTRREWPVRGLRRGGRLRAMARPTPLHDVLGYDLSGRLPRAECRDRVHHLAGRARRCCAAGLDQACRSKRNCFFGACCSAFSCCERSYGQPRVFPGVRAGGSSADGRLTKCLSESAGAVLSV